MSTNSTEPRTHRTAYGTWLEPDMTDWPGTFEHTDDIIEYAVKYGYIIRDSNSSEYCDLRDTGSVAACFGRYEYYYPRTDDGIPQPEEYEIKPLTAMELNYISREIKLAIKRSIFH